MQKKIVYLVLLPSFFIVACSKKPSLENKIYRFIDNLQRENIIISPLSVLEKPSYKFQAAFPSESYPLIDLGSGDNPYGIKRKLDLKGREVNVLFCPPRSRLNYKVKLFRNSILDFGIGIIKNDDSRQINKIEKSTKRGVTFLINLESKGRRRNIFQKHLLYPNKGEPFIFYLFSIDLPDIREEVNLVFETEGDAQNFSFWVNPLFFRKQEESRNVILISIDTLRADHLGCYGYERNTSPNVDALASNSVTFLNTYASSPWTLPSHISMLTSLHGVNHQVSYEDESMDPSIITLADVLRVNQFYCAALTGGGFVHAKYGFSKGFNSYSDEGGILRQDSAEHLFHVASRWLEREKDKSFFLFLHTFQTHNPYACRYPYKTMFIEEDAKWKHIDLLSYLGGKPGIFKELTEKERKNVKGLYDGEIRYTDEEFIGPLIEKLKHMGLYDKTMIIFTSDHGEEFYDHQGWGHGYSLYDESLKVPLIIKFPGSRFKGRRISNFVSLIDIFPTILDELGVGVRDLDIDGKSLFPVIRGQEKGNRMFLADVASNVLDSHIPQKISMNKGDEKLILNKKFKKEDLEFFLAQPPVLIPVEMYDLVRDPREKKNISDTKSELANQIIQNIRLIYKEAKKRKTGKMEMNEELKKQLEALGYIR